MLIKLSPAMDYRQVEIDYFSPKGIFPALAHSWDFVSEKGTLKEILLKIGTIADDLPFKAVILPDRNQIAGTGNESVPIKDWQKYVLEPDKAVIRAGLVQKLGKLTDSQLLDKNLAILTADHIPKSSFLRCYYLKKVLPYNKKRLQRYLYEHNIGELIIKTRGFPHSAESERKKFKLKGKNRLIVLIVRRSNHHQAAIIEKI